MNLHKQWSRNKACVAGWLLAAGLMTGCSTPVGLTGSLWLKKPFHPAAQPNLRLDFATDRADVLVQYDECADNAKHARRRAYWLSTWHSSGTNQPKPHFVNPARIKHLSPVALRSQAPAPEQEPTIPNCAVFVCTPPSFDLWLNGTRQGRFELPAYKAVTHQVGRALLTPLSVSLDVGTLPIQYRD